jgi:hypothetical protein
MIKSKKTVSQPFCSSPVSTHMALRSTPSASAAANIRKPSLYAAAERTSPPPFPFLLLLVCLLIPSTAQAEKVRPKSYGTLNPKPL